MSEARDRYYDIDGRRYMVRYVAHDYYTEWRAWRVSGYHDSGPVYGDAMTREPTDPPMVDGEVRWEGCSNIAWPAAIDCMHHECDRSGLVAIGVLLGRIYDECVALCARSDPYAREDAQPVVVDVMPWQGEGGEHEDRD